MRASLCAVAVMALGAPRWAFLRRRKAPKALSDLWSPLAARRKAAAARLALGLVLELITFPPVMRLWGLSPSQDAKCLALGPFGHVRANLADDLQGGVGVHTVDLGQVDPSHPVQMRSYIEVRGVFLIAATPRPSLRKLTFAAILKPS